MLEFIQPSQVRTAKVSSGFVMQEGQTPAITLVTKNGSQQMMNTPITVPRVLAAFVSLENLNKNISEFFVLTHFLPVLLDYPSLNPLPTWRVFWTRSWLTCV